MSPLPYLSAEQVTFTQEQWKECEARHEEPAFGCPVCFLRLAEREPYAGLCLEALEQALSQAGVEADEAGLKYARELLLDAGAINRRVLAHLRKPQPGGEP